MSEQLFTAEPEPRLKLTADEVKAALRRHHPGENNGSMTGQWTCIEEWLNIDLLALNAWGDADVIGYEVKVSRADLRKELLRPDKRQNAVSRTSQFYLAVPQGLLTREEIAFEEPEWEPEDFERAKCAGVPVLGRQVGHPSNHQFQYGGRCYRPYWQRKGQKRNVVRLPVPRVIEIPEWMRSGIADTTRLEQQAIDSFLRGGSEEELVVCPTCDGKGYVERSRVEREAPTLWVPRDLGLVEITANGVRTVKKAPKRKDHKPIASGYQAMNQLVRWVSHRPDPRHR